MASLSGNSLSVSVVIPVWNEWEHTKACLENLRATLGPRDEVIVVDNGSADQTPRGLKQFSYAKVITNETNLGFAKACNQGAAAAAGDVIVFLNNDTVTPPRWLDGLIAPFSDASVAGTGPRSNFVSGPQLVESIEYSVAVSSAMRSFAKRWREEHKGQTTETTRLVGFCLAVRRSAFEAVGGFDEGFGIGGHEDDDLCLRLIKNGGRLLICHDSFVHHHGHATFDGNGLDWFAEQQKNQDRFRSKHDDVRFSTPSNPILSACLIVKDEEKNLSKALSSLNGVVDEVVIYDTGSTDKTVSLARAAGATVIEGHWDDDFSRARNEALKACTSDWILWIDADEVLEVDPLKFRELLVTTSATSFQVEILNLSADGRSDMSHRPVRVFRRTSYHWKGRLHEQVVPRVTGATPLVAKLQSGRIVHSGYLPEQVENKNKAERNLRMAELEMGESDGRDEAEKLANLGRSYLFANRLEDALATITQAHVLGTELPAVKRAIARAGAQITTTMERPEETLKWAEEFASVSTSQDTARFFRGTALVLLGRNIEALEQLVGLDVINDDDGVNFPMAPVHIARLHAFVGLGRWEEAAVEINLVLASGAADLMPWAAAAQACLETGRPVADLAAKVPVGYENLAITHIAQATPEAADLFLEALIANGCQKPTIYAVAIRIAPQLRLERALEWANLLRNVGLEQHCPLIVIARDNSRSALERISAAAIAESAFEDASALGSFELVARACPVNELRDVILRLNDVAPELLERFIVTAASGGRRAFALAQVLHELGATDEGVAVLMHGIDVGGARDIATSASEWLDGIGRGDLATQILE